MSPCQSPGAGVAALEMKRRGVQRALVSLCVGVGQGMAFSIERVA